MTGVRGSGGIYAGRPPAIINQTPGNYPKESLLHSVHGESLKSRICYYCLYYLTVQP